MATVLVVDDSLTDRRLVGGLLGNQPGWAVTYAGDGREALAQIENALPDMVLTDLQMPEMNGLELVEAVSRDYPRIPVVLMTARGSEEIAVEALRRGAASYVSKKNLARDLVETLEQVWAASRKDLSLARMLLRLTDSEFCLDLHNDPALFPPLVSYLQHAIADIRICNEATCLRIGVAIEEALLNACYHGNLEINSELREEDHRAYYELAAQRRLEAPYRERRVRVRAKLSRSEFTIVIQDDGRGFDPHSLPDPTLPGNLERLSGRGVLLMRTFMDEVKYSDVGNEVTMVKRRLAFGNDVVPSEVLRELRLLDLEQINDVTVVRLNANLSDEGYAAQVVQELFDLVELGRPAKLLLNMSDIGHLHSLVLSCLKDLERRVANNQGRLRLCELRPTVAEVFDVTRLNETFEICANEQMALHDWT